LDPTQLQEAVHAGKTLLRQHPCVQRLLLGQPAVAAPAATGGQLPVADTSS
jgi:hypothetical protein